MGSSEHNDARRADSVTQLLERWRAGDSGSLAELMPLVYGDLRRIANRSLYRERGNHTLQPTALVHETFLRLVGSSVPTLNSREHFLSIAARLMRQILVDYARRVQADRRGGNSPKVPLQEAEGLGASLPVDLLEFDAALAGLSRIDARKARVIELRFFGGLEVKEVADLLEISVPTVVADTRTARAWLLARIDGSAAP